jgi:hypothetical protein
MKFLLLPFLIFFLTFFSNLPLTKAACLDCQKSNIGLTLFVDAQIYPFHEFETGWMLPGTSDAAKADRAAKIKEYLDELELQGSWGRKNRDYLCKGTCPNGKSCVPTKLNGYFLNPPPGDAYRILFWNSDYNKYQYYLNVIHAEFIDGSYHIPISAAECSCI